MNRGPLQSNRGPLHPSILCTYTEPVRTSLSRGTIRGAGIGGCYAAGHFLVFFPAGVIPLFWAGFGVFPWSHETWEIPSPHLAQTSPTQIFISCSRAHAHYGSRSRTNESRENTHIPFPHGRVPKISGHAESRK